MLVYHGTNQANALSILDSGFRKGTWFAPGLDSALAFGGEYVFAAWIDELPCQDCWQFQIEEDWGADRILSLVHYHAELFYAGKETGHEHGQMSICPRCNGDGEVYEDETGRQAVSHLPRTHFLHVKAKRGAVLCPECKGYGDLRKAAEMAVDPNQG